MSEPQDMLNEGDSLAREKAKFLDIQWKERAKKAEAQVAKLTKERDAARSECDQIIKRRNLILLAAQEQQEALRALVNRLDEVHADPKYEAIWHLWQNHFGPYRGLTYEKELQAAREALG